MDIIFVALLLLAQYSTLARSEENRDHAFIGYTEASPSARCSDKLPDCLLREVGNGCLYDAFTMRQFCPATCNIERCSGLGFKVEGRHLTAPYWEA